VLVSLSLCICVQRLLFFFLCIFSISLSSCVFVPKSLATSSFRTDIPMLIYLVLTDTRLKPTTLDQFIVMHWHCGLGLKFYELEALLPVLICYDFKAQWT